MTKKQVLNREPHPTTVMYVLYNGNASIRLSTVLLLHGHYFFSVNGRDTAATRISSSSNGALLKPILFPKITGIWSDRGWRTPEAPGTILKKLIALCLSGACFFFFFALSPRLPSCPSSVPTFEASNNARSPQDLSPHLRFPPARHFHCRQCEHVFARNAPFGTRVPQLSAPNVAR